MKQQKNIFEYDDCGNMTYEYMRGNGTGESTTEVFYTYDELHRVTSAKENYGNAWRNYVYDSLGNLTYEENSNSVHYDYKLNNLNQVTEKTYGSKDKERTVYTYDGRGNLILEEYAKNNGNGNRSTVVKQFVIDYTVETLDPLTEHEVNGLDYRYVYGFQNLRLSVNISPIDGGAGSIVETGTVGEQIRLYYHQDLRGTVD